MYRIRAWLLELGTIVSYAIRVGLRAFSEQRVRGNTRSDPTLDAGRNRMIATMIRWPVGTENLGGEHGEIQVENNLATVPIDANSKIPV